MTRRVVTRVAALTPGRVAVELDGARWRVLPAEAVVRAGLTAGEELTRAQARTLARERRRLRALGLASRALRHRDLPAAELAERLARHGVGATERARAVATLERAHLVDDARFATGRAQTLACRGSGDALIRDDLERRGIAAELVEAALGSLAPESERAQRIVDSRGRTPKTLRFLAARGFGEDVLDGLVAATAPAELG